MRLFFLIIFKIITVDSYSSTQLDTALSSIIKRHDLTFLEPPPLSKRELVALGARLFSEQELSGDKNISCLQCHHPRRGTTDGIAFSIGVTGITRRHSPHLINLGYKEIEHMFWDGRIHKDPISGELQTPVQILNGKKPKRDDITKLLDTSLSAQSIMPLLNRLEMRGHTGNDIADTKSDEQAWANIMTRLKAGKKSEVYIKLFKAAYPKESHYNIGHVGQALASFIKDTFTLVNTPYDSYLKGDKTALTNSEKRGV